MPGEAMQLPDPLVCVLDTFQQRGSEKWGREAVTQLQHALQSAALAGGEQAPDAFVAAALLHDLADILHLAESPTA